MATRVRPTQTCEALNTQIKVLSARVKSMEQQVSNLKALTQLMNIKNVLMMITSAAPNATAAAAILSADPTLLLSIAGVAAESALLAAIPGVPFQVFNANLTLGSNLSLPAFDIPGFPAGLTGGPQDLQNLIASCKSLSLNLS